ncbi:hypothetical protein LR48_Vigan07g196800 [Vigna angularis]|uniref:Uncharacterized protein n=1 Tax=Phaseolus angularis TaxID=3914 RepID=A0A0L9V0H9_PHAAN|nr:hypothetical protein LR48_Vigan07g196800 [Vigna angularis]
MASSSSRCGKKVAHLLRNASPNGWISDDEERYKFGCYIKLFKVVPHKFLDVELFRRDGFIFQEWLVDVGLLKFVEMTDDCYPDLIQVFYRNLKVVDGVICSRVKDVNIKIDDEIWLSFTGLIMSHERNSELNQWTNKKKIYKEYLRCPTRLKVYKPYLLDGLKMEEKMCAFVLTWVILPGRCLRDRLTTADLFLVHAIKTRIPTNWVVVMSEHMIEIASSHGHIFPYGVFITRVLKHHQVDLTGENKIWCTESNEIGKATLRHNGLKKTKDGWVFKDVDETPSTFTPQTEFERFVVDQFRMLSTRISKVEKSLIMIHKKSDEDNALITPLASESDDEDDTIEDESMETSDSD